jgi:5'-nucleotidase
MNRIQAKRLVTLLLIAVCLLYPKALAADASSQPELRFTILHTNDLHAHDDPYLDHGKSIGGMDRIAHLIRSIRSKNPDCLAIDAGDIFQGTPYFTFYHGAVEVQMLNDAGYDIYTIGNHEFDDGPANLAEQLSKAKFDIIDCNLDASAYPPLARLIKPSVVKTIHGEKVGFIGAIVPDLAKVTLHSENVKVVNGDGDWMAPIKAEIAKLKQQGINKIILVTHTGVELDRDLAQLPDVDAIVGGHSHTRLDEPIVVEHPDGSHCIVVQTGSYGRTLGKLDLAFLPDGTLDMANTHDHLINITDRIYPDRRISRYLAKKAKPFIAMRRLILAVATDNFENNFRRSGGDSALGDLITDALAEGAAQYGATIALQNRGGIRSHIDAGPINQEKVEETLPFENHLIVATISGADLRKILEVSVAGTSTNNIMLGAKFLDVHGIKFEWDPGAEPMHRVKQIWAADKSGELKPLQADGDYRLAVNSYTFAGGEGYDFSRARDVKDTGTRLSVYLHDYLEKQKKVQPQFAARIVPLSSLPSVK